MSHDLLTSHQRHSRRRRRSATNDDVTDDVFHVRLHSVTSQVHLHFQQSHSFISPNFKVHRRRSAERVNNNNLFETVIEDINFDSTCFYTGQSPVDSNTSSAVSLCQGMVSENQGFKRYIFHWLMSDQDGRVVKALDLRSNGRMSAWVRTPLLVAKSENFVFNFRLVSLQSTVPCFSWSPFLPLIFYMTLTFTVNLKNYNSQHTATYMLQTAATALQHSTAMHQIYALGDFTRNCSIY